MAWERNVEIIAAILACLAESAMGLYELVASLSICAFRLIDDDAPKKN